MKYPYNHSIIPPALIIPVEIQESRKKISRVVDAKIDTGADITTIPEEIVDSLKLKPGDFVDVRGPLDDYKFRPT
jgi:predicted aspartyl protease